MSAINEEGNRYGKLLVISRSDQIIVSGNEARAAWTCICDCGKITTVAGRYLRNGDVKSCGCLKNSKRGYSYNVKHGMCGTRIYSIYSHMIERCTSKNTQRYARYAGRGITVCEEWSDFDTGFKSFYDWSMKNGYDEKLTIDRIDNDGGYSPKNCRWVDIKTQSNNKSNNRIVEYMGERYTLSNLCLLLNINRGTLKNRLKTGLRDEDLSRAVMTREDINKMRRALSEEQVGEIKRLRNECGMSYRKIASEIGVSYPTVRSVALGLTYKEQRQDA